LLKIIGNLKKRQFCWRFLLVLVVIVCFKLLGYNAGLTETFSARIAILWQSEKIGDFDKR